MNNTCVVFDLDDTLYPERDFVRSAFQEIVNIYCKTHSDANDALELMLYTFDNGGNAFLSLISFLNDDLLTIDILLEKYRNHFPNICLSTKVLSTLEWLRSNRVKMGIISDGRSVSQRNKIKALKLLDFIDFDDIIISEEFGSVKPNERNYKYFMDRFPQYKRFIYVADNPSKDFLAPNCLGWYTICLLDNGNNIHKQDFNLSSEYLPKKLIKNLTEIITFVGN